MVPIYYQCRNPKRNRSLWIGPQWVYLNRHINKETHYLYHSSASPRSSISLCREMPCNLVQVCLSHVPSSRLESDTTSPGLSPRGSHVLSGSAGCEHLWESEERRIKIYSNMSTFTFHDLYLFIYFILFFLKLCSEYHMKMYWFYTCNKENLFTSHRTVL